MKHTINTTPNHDQRHFANADCIRIADAAHRAAVMALRQVGGEEVEWGRRNGSHLDTQRIAFNRLPDSRMFGRTAEGTLKPALGCIVLIDSSGSMDNTVELENAEYVSRRNIARSIAVGIATACDALALGCVVGHHGEKCSRVQIEAHQTTRGVLEGSEFGGNLDAWAVDAFASQIEMPAERTVFVLVCDGRPCGERYHHRAMATQAISRIEQNGGTFVLAFVGGAHDDHGMECAQLDWGHGRVADCRNGMGGLTRAIVHAVARAQG